jgi:hypothetical protein
MKFFGGQRMMTRVHMKAPKRTQKGDRKITILYRITLTDKTVKSAPDVVKGAYDGVSDKSQSPVGIEKEIDNVNIEFFDLPERKQPKLRLKSMYLENLVVKKIHSGKGDTSIVLTFQSELEWEENVWRWLGDNFATDAFLEFDAAQASLLDIPDATAKDDEPEDQMQLEADTEAEPEPVANGKKSKGKATAFNIEDFGEKPAKAGKEAATGSE